MGLTTQHRRKRGVTRRGSRPRRVRARARSAAAEAEDRADAEDRIRALEADRNANHRNHRELLVEDEPRSEVERPAGLVFIEALAVELFLEGVPDEVQPG